MDLLPQWIQRLNDLQFLAPPFPQCRTCLLYADDTLIFLKPSMDQAIRARLLFAIFGQTIGQKISLPKSELAVTAASFSMVQRLANAIQCKPQQFPIRYLGLPLSDKRLNRADYNLIIDRIQNTMAGWRAPLLSIGGRFILTNSVITAIPQFFMSVFLLPKWVIRKIDQIRRRFFWHGHKEQQRQEKSINMVNWPLSTRPRRIGGLGIRDIQHANHALLMKWMWQWQNHEHAWWKQVTIMPSPSDKPWYALNGSIFWKDMRHIAPAFEASVAYQIGKGNKVKFWHDNWASSPLKYLFPSLYQAAHRKEVFVDQCSHEGRWLLNISLPSPRAQTKRDQILLHLQHFQLTQVDDGIVWNRQPSPFSVKSAYNFLSLTPSPDSHVKNVWQIKAPLRIQIFAWLLLTNRLTTTDNLVRRGWYLPNMCSMCKANEETVAHLFQNCKLAKEIRNYMFTAFAQQSSIPHKFLGPLSTQMLTDSKENKCARQLKMVTCFVLWRERCRRIFSGKELQLIPMVREIQLERKNWFQG